MVSRLLRGETLVTGATGFIGANLAHYLVSRGIVPHLTIRKESNPWRISTILKRVKLHYVDLRDKDKVDTLIPKIKPRIIYHCVTYGGYPFQSDSNKIIYTNIMGTINLLKACLKAKFDCFVNTGSSSEYGVKRQPMRETDLLEPLNDYGVAKASATLFCQAIAKKEQLPIVTLRLFSPYGYYEEKSRLIPSVIISCFKGRNPKLSSWKPVRDFIFIEDVIDSYIRATENKDRIIGEIFNVGSGNEYSVNGVVNKIIKFTGSKTKPEWGRIVNHCYEPKCWQADITKTTRLLNWQPKYNLSRGLEKTIEWFRRSSFLYKDRVR